MQESQSFQRKITLHPHQTRAWKSNKKTILLLSGVQGGKSMFGVLWLLREMQQDFDSDYLVTCPSYKILAQSTIPKFMELVPTYLGKYKEQKQEFKFKKGRGRIYFRSTEDPSLLEGMTVKAAWMDEAGQSPRQAFVNIQGRLAIKKGRCLITTTPYFFNWLYDLIKIKPEDLIKSDIEIIQFSSIDNPYFPQSEFDRAKLLLTKEEFERRYLGLFRKSEGLVYSCFDKENIIEPFNLEGKYKRFIGMDFGFNAPFVALFIAKDSDRNYYVYREYFMKQMSVSEHIKFLKLNVEYPDRTIIYPDPSRPDSIKELQLAGFRCFPVDNTIEDGIDKMVELIKTRKLKVFNTCKFLIDEFNTYRYPEEKENKSIRELPLDCNNDGLDSLRYVIFNEEKRYNPNYKPEPAPVVNLDKTTGYREVQPEAESLRERFGIYPLKDQIVHSVDEED